MPHTHSKSSSTDTEIKVGPEYVTYRDWYCSCGQFMGRDIVGRRPA